MILVRVGRRSEMPMFQARIIRQAVAITDVEGDTLEAAKAKLRAWLENDDNLKSLDWVTHSAGSAPEICSDDGSFAFK
jgi:hypothetical protein